MKNEPKIRIKGFEGEWKTCTLEDCLTIYNEQNSYKEFGRDDVLSVSDDYGIVNQIELLGRSYAGVDVSGYKILRPNEIVYTKSPLKMKPYGIIKADRDKVGIVSVLYAVYKVNENISPDYIHYYFDPNYRINRYLLPLINKGAKNTMNISDEMALKGKISIPCTLPEQRAIATYFRHLDSLIETADKKLASLKQVKEASLQSMFPKEGQKVPEVRLKGFEGEWKTSKLSTFAKRVTRKNGNLETELPVTISSQDGIIAQTQFFNSVVASSNLRGYYLIKKGEFAYNKSYSNGYPYGSVKRLEKYDMGALSTLYIVFALSKDIDHDYVIYFFETMLWHNEVAMRAAEGARNHGLLNIGADDFLDIQIIVPTTLSEQRKIASFFVHLDKQIAIAQQRLDLLRRIKSACLDEMFV